VAQVSVRYLLTVVFIVLHQQRSYRFRLASSVRWSTRPVTVQFLQMPDSARMKVRYNRSKRHRQDNNPRHYPGPAATHPSQGPWIYPRPGSWILGSGSRAQTAGAEPRGFRTLVGLADHGLD